MFTRLGRGIVRHPIITVVAWAVALVAGWGLAVFGVTGEGIFDRVEDAAPHDPDSDSARADTILIEAQGYAESIFLMVTKVDLANPETLQKLAGALEPVRYEVGQIAGVARAEDGQAPWVIDPLNPSFCADPAAPDKLACALGNVAVMPWIAQDQRGLEMQVNIAQDPDPAVVAQATSDVVARLQQAAADLPGQVPGAEAIVGGSPLVIDELISQMESDMMTGEMLALPVALIVMVVVFAGFLAAAMPIIGALVSIGSTLGVLWAWSFAFAVDSSVINVVTALGLGLSIDYGLLVVSRYRQELTAIYAAGEPVPKAGPETKTKVKTLTRGQLRNQQHSRAKPTHRAIVATMATAGRTVCYSAGTIAACVAGLMVFRPTILRIFGFGGLLVVLFALLTAVTMVPAVLVLLGDRLARPSPLVRLPFLRRLSGAMASKPSDTGLLSRLAGWVQRRPWYVIAGVLVILAGLSVPVWHMEVRNGGVDMLPADAVQRGYLDELTRNYPIYQPDDVLVVSLGSADATAQWAQEQLVGLKGVAPRPADQSGGIVREQTGYPTISLEVDRNDPAGPEARALVEAIRDLKQPDFEILVTGPAARLLDYQAALAAGAPWAALLIVVAAFVFLFMMTGSVLMPFKALITNSLSLLASLGVVTWL
ncbi:MAG: MMPL family transporter, partial [Micrococcales bacterium]|nr:MMPL family transporter [Micrococcales bacterium]